MKLDTLVGMAKETAAFGVHPSGEYIYSFYTEQLQAFARLVAEHEREACAKVVEAWSDWHGGTEILAKAVRARGQA
jgi:hypothetical protein